MPLALRPRPMPLMASQTRRQLARKLKLLLAKAGLRGSRRPRLRIRRPYDVPQIPPLDANWAIIDFAYLLLPQDIFLEVISPFSSRVLLCFGFHFSDSLHVTLVCDVAVFTPAP